LKADTAVYAAAAAGSSLRTQPMPVIAISAGERLVIITRVKKWVRNPFWRKQWIPTMS
jgi:hypothetical protein